MSGLPSTQSIITPRLVRHLRSGQPRHRPRARSSPTCGIRRRWCPARQSHQSCPRPTSASLGIRGKMGLPFARRNNTDTAITAAIHKGGIAKIQKLVTKPPPLDQSIGCSATDRRVPLQGRRTAAWHRPTQRFLRTGDRWRRNARRSARCAMLPKKASLPAG
jgi:hypothetical protein